MAAAAGWGVGEGWKGQPEWGERWGYWVAGRFGIEVGLKEKVKDGAGKRGTVLTERRSGFRMSHGQVGLSVRVSAFLLPWGRNI